MEIQYITDKKGHKSAVLLPIKTWEKIQKDLKDLEKLKKESSPRLSDKFRGTISKETADKLHKHVNQVRSEWEESIY
ncbi:MAG: hypothetical protein K0B37_03250 [Bacteroidales bacterium]|nr:hypothetical protein [Bacteroidales bacterium]